MSHDVRVPPPSSQPASGAPPSAKPPTDGIVAVNYGHRVGWSGTEAVEVVSEGDSSLGITFNYDGKPEIGTWSHAIPRDAFERLVTALQSSGYDRLPTATNLSPGQSPETFGVRRAGDGLPTLRSFLPTPPEMKEVLMLLHEVKSELRLYPSRVLRGRARWKSAELKRRGEAALEVELSNPGTEPIRFSNPLHDDGNWNGLRLVFRPAKQDSDERSIDLRARDLHANVTVARTPVLDLAPGTSVVFEIRTKVSMGSGRYEARLEVHNTMREQREPDVVMGVLWLDPGPITVAGVRTLWGLLE